MKAESLCSKYIENIKKDQGLQFRDMEDNEETGGIKDTWEKISSADLFEDKTNSPEKAWLVWYSVQEKLQILKSRINERAKLSVADTKDKMLQNLDDHLHKIDKDKVGAAHGSLKDEQGRTASAVSLAVGTAQTRETSRQETVSTQGDSTNQAGGYSSCERMKTASGGGNSGAESLSQADEANEKTSLLRKSKKKTRH